MAKNFSHRTPLGQTLFGVLGLTCLGLLMAGCSPKKDPREVTIALGETPSSLKEATLTVDYSQSGATVMSDGGVPECSPLLPGMSAVFKDDGKGTLTVNAKSNSPFAGPVDLAVCRMIPTVDDLSEQTIASRIRIHLADGRNAAGETVQNIRTAMARNKSGAGQGGDRVEADPRNRAPREDALRERYELPSTIRGGEKTAAGNDSQVDDPSAAAAPAMRVDKNTWPPKTGSPDPGTAAAVEPGALNPRASANVGDAQPGSGASDLDDSAPSGPATNDDEDTREDVAKYRVTIGITSASGPVGAVQFDANHLGSSGGWVGAGGGAHCKFNVQAGLKTCNDKGGGRLSCAFVDVSGFDTPTDLVTCDFNTSEALGRADFSVRATDVSLPDLTPSSADIAVTNLTRIR